MKVYQVWHRPDDRWLATFRQRQHAYSWIMEMPIYKRSRNDYEIREVECTEATIGAGRAGTNDNSKET